MKRTVTQISEINEATNGNLYVVLTFDATVEDNLILPAESRAFFASREVLEKIEAGMNMIVHPIKKKEEA